MRILHVITSINPGGAENQLMSLVRLQRAAGHPVAVAYLREEGGWRREMESLGAEVVDLDMGGARVLRAASRLRAEIARFRPDVLSAHLQPAELCARLALLGTPPEKLPLVITKHNLGIFGRLPGEKALARWVARRASAIVAVSDSVKGLCDRIGCTAAAGRTVVVHNAVDLAPYAGGAAAESRRLRAEWGAADSDVVVGTAGRLMPVKAIDVLLRAFAAFARTRAARLVVVGEGPLLGELRGLAAELGIADKVAFPGFRRDMPAVMGAFDVFALTSDSEGMPMVVLEAMAAAKPVVATAVGGTLELVEDGVTGKLVPPRNPEAAAAALGLFASPESRRAFGDAGRRRVTERFSLERMHSETLAVYESCAASAAARAA